MGDEYQTGEFEALDEGSWVYLSVATEQHEQSSLELHNKIVEACEASGWFTVACPGRKQKTGKGADPGHFFIGVSHAVEHADVVVTLIGARTEMSDAELAMAYTHRRPIVAVRMSGEFAEGSQIQTMLEDYERGRVLTCDTPEECADGLREVFADPDFSRLVRLAR